jgi:hypothetical protein
MLHAKIIQHGVTTWNDKDYWMEIESNGMTELLDSNSWSQYLSNLDEHGVIVSV